MRRLIFVLALAVLAGSIAPAYAQQAPNARVFNGGAGLILYTIKADKTADFEMVMNKTKEALAKSDKPGRKEQAAHWKLLKSDTPNNGNVTYLMVIDPSIKDADYNVINVLNEVFPGEIQALFKAYTEAFATGLVPINLVQVVDFKP